MKNKKNNRKIKNNLCDDFDDVKYDIITKKGKYVVDVRFKCGGVNKRTTLSAHLKANKKLSKHEEFKIIEEAKKRFERMYSSRKHMDYQLNCGELIDKWMDSIIGSVKNSTYNSYKVINEAHLKPFFGEMLVITITNDDINYYKKNKLKTGISNNTIIKHIKQLRVIFKYARELGIINTNPAELVKMPQKKKFHSNIYSVEEMRKLIDKAKNTKLELPIVLAYCCCLRREEVLGLRYSDISPDFTKLNIKNTYVHDGEKNTFVEGAKNESSIRSLEICEDLKYCLMKNKEKQEENKRILGDEYNDEDYVCTDEKGYPLKPNYISQTFKKLIEKNKLKSIRFHDLRHSGATEYYNRVGSIESVSELLGHSSSAITESVYVHKDSQRIKGMAELLNQYKIYGESI